MISPLNTSHSILRGTAAFAALISATLGFATIANAQNVTLRSDDGSLNVSGTLVRFEDKNYVVQTDLGELTISDERVSCEGEGCPNAVEGVADLVFAGSDTVALGLMPLLLTGYASHLEASLLEHPTQTHSDISAEIIGDDGFGDKIGNLYVAASTTGEGFSALQNNKSDISMASRRIRPQEARSLREAGAGNMVSPSQEHIIAVDSIVIVVHPESPIETITMAQLRGIYSGKITNWRELGGPDAQINVINRKQESGTRGEFERMVFGKGLSDGFGNQKIVEHNDHVSSAVNLDPNAIGYVGLAFKNGSKALTLINDCGIASRPDSFSAKVEEYELERRIYMYNRSDSSNAHTQSFLDFVLSEASDGVIAKSGFIDLGIKRRKQDLNGPRAQALLDPSVDAYVGGYMREMLSDMRTFDRLSTTFRFRPGSSKLDERGAIDMQRLVNHLEQQPEGTKVMMVGFTDDIGAFDSNRTLSQQRAEQIMDALRAEGGERLAGIEFASKGFGEIAPAACNATETGRGINRRVEVWIEVAQRT